MSKLKNILIRDLNIILPNLQVLLDSVGKLAGGLAERTHMLHEDGAGHLAAVLLQPVAPKQLAGSRQFSPSFFVSISITNTYYTNVVVLCDNVDFPVNTFLNKGKICTSCRATRFVRTHKPTK